MARRWYWAVYFGGALALAVGAVQGQGDEHALRVGVVVQGPDSQPETFCVTLPDNEPTGIDALQATGLHAIMSRGALGSQVCRIGAVGCTPPGESCFCQCQESGICAYWSYFHLTAQDTWHYSGVGAAGYKVADGDVEGWWWRASDAQASDFPPVTFEEICAPEPVFPRTVVDGLGRATMVAAPPQRIASVTLGSDEILLDLVGPERLLGVTYMAADPVISNISGRLDAIPNTDLSSNAEYLISLDADLVILAAYNDPALIDQLLDAGMPVFVLAEFNTLDDVRANIRLLGEVTGEEARAEAVVKALDTRLNRIHAQVADQVPVRVLYYELGGITYGPGSTVDEIITLAGGVNVVADAGLGPYPLVDTEFVLASDPDAILVSAGFETSSDPVELLSADPVLNTLRAVQEGRIYAIPNAHMTNVSHYVALGVEDVARALYPAAFDEE